jgi:hypothetical protein
VRGRLRDERDAVPVLLRERARGVDLVRGARRVHAELVDLQDLAQRVDVEAVRDAGQRRVGVAISR